MDILIYDDKENKTKIVSVEKKEIDESELEFFDDHSIRKVWHSGHEEWYLSILDVVQVLTDSADPKQYIKKMRTRDKDLSSKWGTICTPLQMPTSDGKMRKIQAANTEGILRIIQSITSPKAATIAGGKIAGDARKALEEQLGHSILSELNATTPELLDDTEKNK